MLLGITMTPFNALIAIIELDFKSAFISLFFPFSLLDFDFFIAKNCNFGSLVDHRESYTALNTIIQRQTTPYVYSPP